MERVAIVGTAGSWRRTPWNDAGLYIMSLNDAYRMGLPRADRWYDFHPLDKFYHPPVEGQPIHAHLVPPGHYVRPADHLDWLAKQTIPVYLHPDYMTQHPAATDWRHARPIPRDLIESYYGSYFTSSPAYMMAHAMIEGAKEIWVTGIHLATQGEYERQRAQWELMCGRFLGAKKQTLTVKDGFRHYETQDAHLVLPVESPVLTAPATYPFETHPDAYLEPIKWDRHRYSVKRERAVAQLKAARWYQPTGTIRADLERVEALLADTDEQMARAQAARQMGA